MLSNQCFDRRIPDPPMLAAEVKAWQKDRNANHAKADWHFAPANARIILKTPIPRTLVDFRLLLLSVPSGFPEAPVRPGAAFFSRERGEFILPYVDVRRAASPDETLLDFPQSTYEAPAKLGYWWRAGLERVVA